MRLSRKPKTVPSINFWSAVSSQDMPKPTVHREGLFAEALIYDFSFRLITHLKGNKMCNIKITTFLLLIN